MIRTSRPWLAASVLLSACTPQRAHVHAAPPAVVASAGVPQVGPLPQLPQLAVPHGQCPLSIVPGRALGPIRLGSPLSSLDATGLTVKKVSRHDTTEFVEAGPFRVQACGGTIVEAWIDDLQGAPDCVKVGDKPVDRAMKREAFEAMFTGCHGTEPPIGGAFTECEAGGVRIGYGMGNFIQVRVARPGADIDEECADVLDDGGVVTLAPTELAALVQRTLDIDRLAGFWHAEMPHRDPLRLVRSPFLASIAGNDVKSQLSMFGSKVAWLDAARDGRPYFEFTKLKATRHQVELHFRYPVEGVVGSVTFQKRGDDWQLKTKNVAER